MYCCSLLFLWIVLQDELFKMSKMGRVKFLQLCSGFWIASSFEAMQVIGWYLTIKCLVWTSSWTLRRFRNVWTPVPHRGQFVLSFLKQASFTDFKAKANTSNSRGQLYFYHLVLLSLDRKCKQNEEIPFSIKWFGSRTSALRADVPNKSVCSCMWAFPKRRGDSSCFIGYIFYYL